MREIIIKKGERRRILHLVFDSIPQLVTLKAEPMAPATPLGGTVEVVHSQWLFAKAPASQNLAPDNALQKGFWDSFFSIFVTPDQDTRITFQSRHFIVKYLIYAFAILIVLAAASGFLIPLLSSRG